MSSITSGSVAQYADRKKPAARGRLNREYTIAETGWFPWIARLLPLKTEDRVVDIGCGLLEVDKQTGLFLSRKEA